MQLVRETLCGKRLVFAVTLQADEPDDSETENMFGKAVALSGMVLGIVTDAHVEKHTRAFRYIYIHAYIYICIKHKVVGVLMRGKNKAP